MTHKISETDDRITIVENIPAWGIIITILFGIFFLWLSYKLNSFSYKIINFTIGGSLIFCGAIWLLVGYSITIDKKSERIIIKDYKANINFLKPIKEMPFSDINKIEIERHKYIEEDFPKWTVNLIKIQGDSTEIYETDYESDAEGLAEKISKMTKGEITRK